MSIIFLFFLYYHINLIRRNYTTNENLKRDRKLRLWRKKVEIICDEVIKNVKIM